MKKGAALILAAMMLCTTACSSGSGKESATASPKTDTQTTAGTEAAGEEKAETGGETAENTEQKLSGHIEYWSSWGETESQARVLQKAAEEFMELNPDVTINFTFNGRDNRNLLVSAMQAGTEIDMMDANWDNCVALWSDYIADLTDYYYQPYPTTDGKNYIDCVMDAYSGLIADANDGRYKGVAYIPQAFMIFCNKDIFEACNITSYPQTWEELMEDCQIIKDAGYIPVTDEDQREWAWYSYYLQRKAGAEAADALAYDSSLWKEGSEYYDAVKEAAEAIAYMAEKGYFDPNVASNVNPTAQQNMVINGDIAMYINGTWLPNETSASNEDFNWGAFAFPEVKDGVDGREATAYGTYAICVNKECSKEETDAAFAFAVFLTTGKYDEMFRDETKSIPMGVDAQWPEALAEAKEVLMGTSKRYMAQLNLKLNGDSSAIIGDACMGLESGRLTAEEFIKEAGGF